MENTLNKNSLQIESEKKDAYSLVRVKGRFIAENILTIRKMLEQALENGHTRIVLDLSGVEYLDSTGIGLIISFSKKMKETGGKLVVANPSPAAFDIIDVSGTKAVLDIRRGIGDKDLIFP